MASRAAQLLLRKICGRWLALHGLLAGAGMLLVGSAALLAGIARVVKWQTRQT